MMFVLMFVCVFSVQLQAADARSFDDVNHVAGSPASDVITAPSVQLRGRHPTSLQQQEQSHARSKSASGGGQAQKNYSASSSSFAAASPYARYGRPLPVSKRTKMSVNKLSSSFSKTQKAGSRIPTVHSDVGIAAIISTPTTTSSLPDTELFNAKSSSAALTSMSCLWVYSSNKVLRKRLCNCNVGPLQVLAKASTALQFYFCENEQDLLATLACYVSNNGTLSVASKGRNNCLDDRCNVGPLWIQRSDESTKQAAYYCSSNVGIQLGELHTRTTARASSRFNVTTDPSTYSNNADHRRTPRPKNTTHNNNGDIDYLKRPTIINSVSHWSSAERPLPTDTSRRRPVFGSHARVPGTVPNNTTLQKQTKAFQ